MCYRRLIRENYVRDKVGSLVFCAVDYLGEARARGVGGGVEERHSGEGGKPGGGRKANQLGARETWDAYNVAPGWWSDEDGMMALEMSLCGSIVGYIRVRWMPLVKFCPRPLDINWIEMASPCLFCFFTPHCRPAAGRASERHCFIYMYRPELDCYRRFDSAGFGTSSRGSREGATL